MSFLSCFTGTSLGYDNRGRITSSYAHNSEFIYSLSYLRNSNVLQQELYGSYRDYFANTEDLVYKFTYDKSNRLLNATNTAGSPNEYKVENTYDKDGNILTLKRYGDAGVMQDDFAYQYYSGTNKLRKVTGTADLYQYDLNGNVTTDSLNKNTSAVYDHRNLLIEIYHKRGTPPARIDYFATRYFYDEAGNRIRKLTYKNNDANAGPVLDWNNTSNPGNNWTLFNNEHYVRGVDGKELATYTNNSLDDWYVWGTDMVGKIKGNTKYYFFKDHLGSVRAVVDNNFNLVSAVDYDMWGDKMQGRIYNGDSTKFGFTGKEEDEESYYDYFGARYYHGRVANWISVDPLLEKHYQWSPYNYVLRNPMILVDPFGEQVFVGFSGFGGHKVFQEINPSNYSPISTIGTEILLYKIQNAVNDLGLLNEVNIKGYYTSTTDIEIVAAAEFVKQNLDKNDEQVFIYGVSEGGISATRLAEILGKENIQVEVLFTVDAFDFMSQSGELMIPENVKTNWNFYQTAPDPLTGARGTVNKAANEKQSKIRNKLIENSSHKDIDEQTNDKVETIFKNKLR